MNKQIGLLSGMLAIVLGLSMSNAALATGSVAIVDVPQVVGASAQVQALKKEQQNKANEIIKYVENARKDLASITDANKKKTAEEKYNKELQTKREKIEKEYSQKLQTIDTTITNQINDYAKTKGYDLVITKGVVLYGGTDITADLIKIVK